jgi:hypothetical protein
MKTKNIFLCTLVILASMSYTDDSLASTKGKKITVVVKEIGEMSESGDGYTFITKSGKTYYLYNGGGTITNKGEEYIQESIDKKTPICLRLQNGDGAGDIASITKGVCKKQINNAK